MGWRTVILTKESKLSLRMNHLVVASDETKTIFLEEINSLIIENPSISITGHVMNALVEAKIHVILCDKSHLPMTNIQSIYGHHRQSKHIGQQINWIEARKELLWKILIEQKLTNQANLLEHFQLDGYEQMKELINNVELGDATNREGYGAKIYFHKMYGNHFIRGYDDAINAGLNYGYALLHSLFARLIVSKGYLMEIGVFHKNEYNQYNLASDLMEIFRPIVDGIVYSSDEEIFTKNSRRNLIHLFEYKIDIRGKQYYLTQAAQIFVDSCMEYLNTGNKGHLQLPKLDYKAYKWGV